MVIYPSALVLSAQAAGAPLSLPRILWQTYTREGSPVVTASSEALDAAADLPLDPSTAGYWQALSLPATWVLDFGVLRDIDYVGIAEHNLGSSGAAVLVETSNGDLVGSPPLQVWQEFGGSGISPGKDAPLAFFDTLRNVRYVRLTITGSGAMPKIAVVYAGQALVMPMTPIMGHQPIALSRRTELRNSKSRGGQFLAQNIKQMGVETSATFSRLQQDWYREEFDPFVQEARRFPYFFILNAEEYPLELGYVWTQEDIRPAYVEWDFFSVSFDMEGIGSL